MTQDVYVENPKWEKPREPTDSNYHYEERYNQRLGGNDLELCFFAQGQLQQSIALYLSLSLSLFVQQLQ